jgi:cytochrome oxidase Cu insertion factor (SCO1/SenC/PrrC family)
VTPSNVSIPAPAMALAEFDLVNVQGEKVTRDDVLGKPAVFAFVFSRCTSTCPPIMLETQRLHNKLADADVRFFTVTIDPEFDTVEHFGNFVDTYSPNPDRWQCLTGSKETIHNMIKHGFRQVVEEVFGKDRKPGAEFTHTNRVVLVNADGIPVETYLILNDGDRAKLLRVLQGKDPFPQPPTGTESVTITRGDGTTQDLSAGP